MVCTANSENHPLDNTVSTQMMDRAVRCSSTSDPSAHTQCRNLQIKAHRFDFISVYPLGALQHFPGDNHPRTIPPCSLQGAGWLPRFCCCSNPAHQYIHQLSAGWDLHTPLQHWVPGILEEHGMCESAWAGTHLWVQPALGTVIPRYNGTAARATHQKRSKGCSPHCTLESP